jgi:hypothetical protein
MFASVQLSSGSTRSKPSQPPDIGGDETQCSMEGATPSLADFPHAPEGESVEEAQWFTENSAQRVSLSSLLQIARDAKCDSHNCNFGERVIGGFNVAITIHFVDRQTGLSKSPKPSAMQPDEDWNPRPQLFSSCKNRGMVHTPAPHGYSPDVNSPSGAPYILMEKIRGVPLQEALDDGMTREQVHRVLEQLADFRKALRQHKFVDIGSLTLYDGNYRVFNLINVWNFYLDPAEHKNAPRCTSYEYYFAQHALSLLGSFLSGDRAQKLEMWSLHAYMVAILPSYALETSSFYLAHTDLSIANIMVDPDKGTLTGIIDWEFAITLPLQTAEHYPASSLRKVASWKLTKKYSRMLKQNWRIGAHIMQNNFETIQKSLPSTIALTPSLILRQRVTFAYCSWNEGGTK